MLAESLAKGLGRELRADVEWHALGVDGGDSRAIRAAAAPELRRIAAAAAGQAGEGEGEGAERAVAGGSGGGRGGTGVDMCVLLCGLNDFKVCGN